MDSKRILRDRRPHSARIEPSGPRGTGVPAERTDAAPPRRGTGVRAESADAAPPLPSAAVPILKPKDDRRVYHHLVLPNSLACLLICDPASDKGAVSLSVRVGYFCDGDHLEGLAHLLQNSMLYGSELFDDFSSYVALNNGSIRTSTYAERSSFCYDVDSEILPASLVRFANFFVKPTIYTDTFLGERVEAVNSETDDTSNGIDQLKRYLTKVGHPYQKYRPDNWLFVDDKAKKKGLNLREELERFYNSYYSSGRMSLVIYAKECPEELLSLVKVEFGAIGNTESKPLVFPCHPCEDTFYQILVKAPRTGGQSLTLQWHVSRNLQEAEAVDACTYLTHVFNLQGEGSISFILKNLGWSLMFEAGERDSYSKFSFFFVHIELTTQGQVHLNDVVGLVFNYIKMLKKEKPRKYLFNQFKAICEAQFQCGLTGKPIEQADTISSNMLIHSPENCLVGSSLLSVYSVKAIEHIVNELSSKTVRIFWASSEFEYPAVLTKTVHGNPYSVEDVDIQEWINAAPIKRMFLPLDNLNKTTASEAIDKKTAGGLRVTRLRGSRQKSSAAMEKVASVCIIYDDRMAEKHIPPFKHVEAPGRIRAIYRRLREDGVLNRCTVYGSERAPLTYVAEVHNDDYVTLVLKEQIVCQMGPEDDMYFVPSSEEPVFLAAGGSIKAARMVAAGKHKHSFAIVRPPGHHAKAGGEGGFCYFNNVAIAAKCLMREHNIKKILILDWNIRNFL